MLGWLQSSSGRPNSCQQTRVQTAYPHAPAKFHGETDQTPNGRIASLLSLPNRVR